ncbi:MAG: B12-binding domain-containing radical SAM protein [Candidatus Bathyarchaeota archaeon]|nr:B12-binding domain-containing radical SAM protein [Candidatus Bathyarchaeota archaeon]
MPILLITTAPPAKSPWGMAGRLPPLGLAYVAAALEKYGFEVEIFDNYLLERPIEEVKTEISKRAPEIVGITCSSLTYERCIETAKAVKEALPSCKVVVGGPHPSYMPETMLQHTEIDYVVIGEGEQAIVKLAKALTREQKDNEVAQIPGIAYGEIRNAPEFIAKLDKIPFPARHLLPMKMYDRRIPYLNVEPVDTMSIIRGCPYSCAYCETKELWGNTCRTFTPQRIIDEIEYMIKTYSTKGIYFVGDNFTINKKKAFQLCGLIKKNKIDIKWVCDTRADLVSRALLREMKNAGCQTIFFGVESGSPPIMEKLNKNLSLQKISEAFELCKQEGIQTVASFMLGIPGETMDDMQATFEFAKQLNPDWCQFNIYVACPGSKLYNEVIQKGLYDQMDNFLARVKTAEFDYDMLLKVQRQFQSSFNKSPARLIRVIKRDGVVSALKKGVSLFLH